MCAFRQYTHQLASTFASGCKSVQLGSLSNWLVHMHAYLSLWVSICACEYQDRTILCDWKPLIRLLKILQCFQMVWTWFILLLLTWSKEEKTTLVFLHVYVHLIWAANWDNDVDGIMIWTQLSIVDSSWYTCVCPYCECICGLLCLLSSAPKDEEPMMKSH